MDKPRRLTGIAVALALAGCDSRAATAPVAAAGDWGAEAPSPVHEPGSAIVAAGERFACTPEKVWDGDGPIHCAEGPRVRLAGIAAREMDGSCSPGHPCPEATAPAARDALSALLGRTTGSASTGHLLVEGPTLQCRSEGSAGGSRTAAWCRSPTAGDLSCAMVASGTVAKWPRYWRGHGCG
jgi:endonuclease YncB( thermonuclease family)